MAGAVAIDIFNLPPSAPGHEARNGDVESIRKLQQVHMFLTCGVVEARVLSILMSQKGFRLKRAAFSTAHQNTWIFYSATRILCNIVLYHQTIHKGHKQKNKTHHGGTKAWRRSKSISNADLRGTTLAESLGRELTANT